MSPVWTADIRCRICVCFREEKGSSFCSRSRSMLPYLPIRGRLLVLSCRRINARWLAMCCLSRSGSNLTGSKPSSPTFCFGLVLSNQHPESRYV